MDLSFSDADEQFRHEVRDFIAANLPPDIQARAKKNWMHSPKGDVVVWHKRLYERGWVAPSWPQEFGGPGWSLTQRYIFEEETARAHCPRISPFGITMVGPVIYTFGTDAQKARFLPPILSGDEFWCQGYSEPGAGSDLASLNTRAERVDDHYVVSGQKTWTSGAHKADWMFCLARTKGDGKPQAGISFLLMDMTAEGVSVEPIVSMDEDHYLNNVFLDNVRVPIANRVGEENDGWTYAKFLLGNERTGIAGVGRSKTRIAQLKEMAKREFAYGEPLSDDPDFRRRVAEVEIDLQALEITNLRSLAAESGNASGDNAIASILKIKGTEIEQAINEMMVEVLGYYAVPFVSGLDDAHSNERIGPDAADGVVAEHLLRRSASIFGGTNEIQKNIIAKMVLGL